MLSLLLSLVLPISLWANWGHRAGGDLFKHLPENSLLSLEASLKGLEGHDPIQFNSRFQYLEFDVQETFDGHLVVFHDKKLYKKMPIQGKNREVYADLVSDPALLERNGFRKIKAKKLRVRHLLLSELRRLRLKGQGDQAVPTLDEFYQAMADFGLIKPVAVEIKYLHSDRGRLDLITKTAAFKEAYLNKVNVIYEDKYDLPGSIGFMAFAKKFKGSYGVGAQQFRWCEEFWNYGFAGISRPVLHNIIFCDRPNYD